MKKPINDYEINIKLSIPFTVNVKASDKKTAQGLAENLIADFLSLEVWEGEHKEYESGTVDQWGEIKAKVLKFSKYGRRTFN